MLHCLKSFDAAVRRLPRGLGSVLVATLLALAAASPARAVSYTWNNAAGGDWGTAANWTPNGVPNATADTAAITLAGTYTVTVVGSFTVGSVAIGGASGTQTLSLPGGGSGGILTLNAGVPTATMTVNANGAVNQSGGTLQTSGGNPGQVTVNGRYDWSGGSVNYASFTVAPTGTLALAGVSVKSLQLLQLVNNGTMVIAGAGSLQIENNSTVTNTAGAVIDLQGDGGLQQNGGGNSVLNNAGLIRKTVGAGTANITTAQFNNTGVVDAQTGTLQIANGSTRIVSSGAGNAFNAQAGATLNIGWVTNPSSFTGTTFGGPGAKTIGSSTSASYVLAGTIAMTNTTLAGGSLAGTFTLNGTLAWTGGEMITGGGGAPVVTVATGSTLALSGVAEKRLSGVGASLVNNGTISIAGNGNLQVENNASLANAATGTIDLQSDAGITQSGGGTSTLTNAGLVRKSGGTGTSSITLASVANNGNMQAQSGTLLISRNGGLTLQAGGPGNAFNAQAGAALTIGWVGSATLADTTFGGPGAKTIGTTNAPHTWTGTITATNTTIIEGLHSGTFTLNGTLNWIGGQLVGGATPLQLTIPAGATLIAGTSGQKILSGNNPTLARITNGGTLRLAGTNGIDAQGSPQIVNLPSGLIEFASTGGLSAPSCCSPSVANAGTLRLAPGAGSVTVSDWSIANTGTISLQAGTLQFFGTANTFAQTAGKLELVGGNLSTTRPLPITGGQLTGAGAIFGSGAVTVSGSAQTRPGTSPGQITIGGAYTQTGTLVAELNGPAPGTQYDQVVAQGAVALGGTLTVSLGAVPAVGTAFRVIDNTGGGAISGAFVGLPEGATFTVQGSTLQISYVGGTGNDVTLTVVSNSGLPCDAYSDVDAASPFCPNVEWMKKRGVTLGCAVGLYCPTSPTTRLQMALFMNRLGTTLTTAPVRIEAAPGPLNPATNPVVCTTGDVPAATYERRASIDAVLMGQGQGTGEMQVEVVGSVDGGAIWVALGPPVPAGVANGRWANVRLNVDRDVAPTEVVRYGLRLTQLTGAGTLAASRCLLRLQTGNRNPNASPDADE